MKRTFKVRILYDAYREYTIEARNTIAAENIALSQETRDYTDECDHRDLMNAGFRHTEITEVKK